MTSAELMHAALLEEVEAAERRVPPEDGIASIIINPEGAPSRNALVIMRHSTVVAHELGTRPGPDWKPEEVRPYAKLREA
jgi:hypothetical protein